MSVVAGTNTSVERVARAACRLARARRPYARQLRDALDGGRGAASHCGVVRLRAARRCIPISPSASTTAGRAAPGSIPRVVWRLRDVVRSITPCARRRRRARRRTAEVRGVRRRPQRPARLLQDRRRRRPGCTAAERGCTRCLLGGPRMVAAVSERRRRRGSGARRRGRPAPGHPERPRPVRVRCRPGTARDTAAASSSSGISPRRNDRSGSSSSFAALRAAVRTSTRSIAGDGPLLDRCSRRAESNDVEVLGRGRRRPGVARRERRVRVHEHRRRRRDARRADRGGAGGPPRRDDRRAGARDVVLDGQDRFRRRRRRPGRARATRPRHSSKTASAACAFGAAAAQPTAWRTSASTRVSNAGTSLLADDPSVVRARPLPDRQPRRGRSRAFARGARAALSRPGVELDVAYLHEREACGPSSRPPARGSSRSSTGRGGHGRARRDGGMCTRPPTRSRAHDVVRSRHRRAARRVGSRGARREQPRERHLRRRAARNPRIKPWQLARRAARRRRRPPARVRALPRGLGVGRRRDGAAVARSPRPHRRDPARARRRSARPAHRRPARRGAERRSAWRGDDVSCSRRSPGVPEGFRRARRRGRDDAATASDVRVFIAGRDGARRRLRAAVAAAGSRRRGRSSSVSRARRRRLALRGRRVRVPVALGRDARRGDRSDGARGADRRDRHRAGARGRRRRPHRVLVPPGDPGCARRRDHEGSRRSRRPARVARAALARQRFLDAFTIERSAAEMVRFYRRVLGAGPPEPNLRH